MTLLPLTLANKITMPCKGKRYFFSTHDINQGDMSVLTPSDIVFFIRDGHVIRKEGIKEEIVIHVNDLPSVILVENCIAILAILEYINIDIEIMQYAAKTFTNHGHRIEKIATINGVDFYNDSKATIIQATHAAVQKLQSKPLILLIGGLSKGVDRSPLFPLLRGSVEHVICFGAQAQELYSYAHDAQLSAYAFPTLEEAFKQACDLAQPSYQILFSPSGSSFDLFKNYQDRGEVFKKLTLAYQQQSLF